MKLLVFTICLTHKSCDSLFLKMSRTPEMTLSALNIAVHPHDRKGATYINLFKRAYSLNKSIKIYGSTYGLIGTMFESVTDKPELGLEGDIFTFTNINFDSDWFNSNTNKAISSEDIKNEVELPEYLKPNLERSRYIFYPLAHRFVFVSKFRNISLSPLQAESFFKTLFSDTRIAKEFSQVDVTVEQSKEGLNAILTGLNLESLTIVIKLPNPDGPTSTDATITKVLDEQNAREQRIELKRARNKFLKPSQANKDLADLARSNGFVQGTGENGKGKRVTRNTHNHPLKKKYSFYPEIDFRSQMKENAEKLVKTTQRK